MEWVEVETRVKCALDALEHCDLRLLEYGVNERTICARLAVHLKAVFQGYDVDVEYNRHGMDPKRVEVDPGLGKDLVYPDVIVHRRGTDESNLLVMEVKKSTNREPRGRDRKKLKCCVEQFKYEFAVLVDIPIRARGTTAGRRSCMERVHPVSAAT